eukprot:4371935-Pyramimonas_sp.AAC.1
MPAPFSRSRAKPSSNPAKTLMRVWLCARVCGHRAADVCWGGVHACVGTGGPRLFFWAGLVRENARDARTGGCGRGRARARARTGLPARCGD